MTESDHIELIKKWLFNTYGVKVEIKFDSNVSGTCYYSKKIIELNEPNAEKALMVLLHEAGHYHSYVLYHDTVPDASHMVRESWAMQYGWQIAKALGIKIDALAWSDLHDDIHSEYFLKYLNKNDRSNFID